MNLSTIMEIDTPASTRPSEAGMSGSTHSEASQLSKKSLDFSRKEKIPEIPEKSILEEVETQMQSQAKAKGNFLCAIYCFVNFSVCWSTI